VPKDDIPPHEQYVVDVLLNCAQASTLPKDRSTITATPGGVLPCPSGQKGEPLVVPVLLSTLNGISHLRIVLHKDLRPNGPRETVWKMILEVQRRSPDGIPFLDPIENMGIKDEKFEVLVKVNSRLSSILLSV
jgi:ATP-dependent RNA helicase DOB1